MEKIEGYDDWATRTPEDFERRRRGRSRRARSGRGRRRVDAADVLKGKGANGD